LDGTITQQRTRSSNGSNFWRFLEGFGVRLRPISEARGWKDRPANVIYGGRTAKRLYNRDEARMGLVIRCIQASNPRCFDDVVIWSVWRLLVAHFDIAKPQQAIVAFRLVDLQQVRERARRLANGQHQSMEKSAAVISTLLADAMIPKDDAA
jgi:hypothetical protein